jgi:hypothetical protein
MQFLIFSFLRYIAAVFNAVNNKFYAFMFPKLDTIRPHSQYFMTDDRTVSFDEDYTRVPEDTVYIEEWVEGTHKKCVVLYEGDEIPKTWKQSPFARVAKCPWIWVGDRDTEIDLTRTFGKFLVVGNVIELALVLKLIQITDRTNLIYIESGTFNEIKFPGDGIVIEEYAE